MPTWKRKSLLQKLAATLGKKLRELKKSEWDDNANATPSLITNSLNFFFSLACTKTLPSQTHTNIHLLNNTQWKTLVRDGSLRCYKSGSFHRLTTWHTTDSERKRSEAEKSKRNNRSGLMKQQIQEKRTEEGKANNMELIKSQSIPAVKKRGHLIFRIYIYLHNSLLGSDVHAACSFRQDYYLCVYPREIMHTASLYV